MQWAGPGSGAREQIIGLKWLTRCGEVSAADDNMATFRSSGYPGKTLRGATVSYAMRDADIETEFGADVVLATTAAQGGFDEDILFPAGVLDDDVIIPDAPWQKKLVRVVMFGRVEGAYCTASADTDKCVVYLSNKDDNGTLAAYSLAAVSQGRRLVGSGTSTGAAGAFDLSADAATIDWTHAEGVPFMDTDAATGVAAVPLAVPNAGNGLVGLCKYGAPTASAYPNAAPMYTAMYRRQVIVMCLSTSVGRI